MSKYEITLAQRKYVFIEHPEASADDNYPIQNDDWYQAIEFCNRLSDIEGLEKCYSGTNVIVCNFEANGYRLPTEAEWEYACRAGTTGNIGGTGNLAVMGWYIENSGLELHPVGQKNPKHWGIYDMHGNILEWVWDWYAEYSVEDQTDPTGPFQLQLRRILRGGSASAKPDKCTSATRWQSQPTINTAQEGYKFFGFRVVRTKK